MGSSCMSLRMTTLPSKAPSPSRVIRVFQPASVSIAFCSCLGSTVIGARLHAFAVNDGRDKALTAQGPGAALADSFPQGDVKFSLCHVLIPPFPR